MAEGTSVTVPELTEPEGTEEVVVAEEEATTKESDTRVVRPKEKKPQNADPLLEKQEEMEKGATQSTSGHCWHSFALTSQGEARARTPPPVTKAMFQGWRERRWMEDDDQD